MPEVEFEIESLDPSLAEYYYQQYKEEHAITITRAERERRQAERDAHDDNDEYDEYGPEEMANLENRMEG